MIEFNQCQKVIPFNDANLSTALNDFDLAVSKRLLFVVDKMNIVNSIYYKSTDNKLTILPIINSAGTTRLTSDAIALLDELIKAISNYRKARLKDEVLEDVNDLLSEKHGNIKVVNKYFSKLELFGATAVSLIADVEVTNKEIRTVQKNGRVTIDKIPEKKVIDGTTSFVPTDASNEEVKLSTSIIYNNCYLTNGIYNIKIPREVLNYIHFSSCLYNICEIVECDEYILFQINDSYSDDIMPIYCYIKNTGEIINLGGLKKLSNKIKININDYKKMLATLLAE